MVIEAEALELRVRANYKCEYCGSSLLGSSYELDHIVPRVLSGSDALSNLAVTCVRCNRNKGSRVTFVDPFTQSVSAIFNPRTQKWNDHFHLTAEGEVVGRTAIGRATAALLFRTTRQLLPPDLSWDKIEGLQRSERVYRFLNELRFRRLHNQFKELESSLRNKPESLEVAPAEEEIFANASRLLQLEMLTIRSTLEDVNLGIALAETMFQQSEGMMRRELATILSIFYQQRAAVYFSKNNRKAAERDQAIAAKLHSSVHHESENEVSDQVAFRNRLREESVPLKYTSQEISNRYLTNVLRAAIDLSDDKDWRHLVYLTDLALADSSADAGIREAIYDILTEILDGGGYGQLIDRAKFVTVRRRWWILHLLLERDPWFDALRSDVSYWRQLQMHNEVRELQVAIRRIATRLPTGRSQLAMEAIR